MNAPTPIKKAVKAAPVPPPPPETTWLEGDTQALTDGLTLVEQNLRNQLGNAPKDQMVSAAIQVGQMLEKIESLKQRVAELTQPSA